MISTTIKHKVKSFPEIQNNSSNRLFIFAESRSGSTWLINTLTSHPDIGLLDEVINPDYAKTLGHFLTQKDLPEPDSALQKIENIVAQLQGRYKGCKILYPQAVRFIDFYEFILNYRNANFIILTRENSLRAEISGLIANEHSRWHLTEIKEKEQISVSPGFLFERLQWRKYSRNFCINMIESYCDHYLKIEYRELFTGIPEMIKKISDFLSIQNDLFTFSREIKSNPFLLTDILINYEDCRSFFNDKPEISQFFKNDNTLG